MSAVVAVFRPCRCTEKFPREIVVSAGVMVYTPAAVDGSTGEFPGVLPDLVRPANII